MSPEDREDLAIAKTLLENPGIAAKLADLLGTPIEQGFALLPGDWRDRITTATRDALMMSLKSALLTMDAGGRESFPVSYTHLTLPTNREV